MEENDNLSKDSPTDTVQAGSDATAAASDTGSIHHPQSITSASAVKTPVQSTAEVAVEHIKDHGQSINLSDIEELAKTVDEGYVADVTTLGLTELQDGYSKLQSRSNLYKNRLLQITSAYKDVDSEKEQLKVNNSRAEERHRRQISELKEQIQLDSQAKRDLENNYSLMLDEKDEMIQVLRMKIKLIKDEGSADGKGSSPGPKQQTDAGEESQLKEKVKRLEALLTKCKDTIKSNKERIQQLTTDRDAMAKQAQERMDELEKFKKSTGGEIVGQGTVAVAAELTQSEDLNKQLQVKVAKLEKAGQEQLEKSREIIRQLKEQKNHLEDEVKRLQSTEPRSESTKQEPSNNSESSRKDAEEALKNKTKELLEEIEILKTESEEKLREENSRHSSELTSLQERLKLEHEKRIDEIAIGHQQRLTEVAAENEKLLVEVTKRMETEFVDKLEKQMALLEQQRVDAEKMKISDDRELDEIRRRLVDLEEQVEHGHAELEAERKKGVQILEKNKDMEEEVRELEGMIDSQRKAMDKAETEINGLKHELLTKADEFNLSVKHYEDEIEHLRKDIEHKALEEMEKNVPEIPDAEGKSMQTGSENIQEEDKLKVSFGLKLESEPTVRDETDLEDEPKFEDKRKKKDEPSKAVESQIEIENLELKEMNRTLTDSIEAEKNLSKRLQDEIEQMKADGARQLGEINQRLVSSSEMITQMEQRMNDAMERENQLNMELETAKIDNEQNLALRNEEIVSLQATINELKNLERALRDTGALQNEKISSLQETIDRLNSSEQALKEQSASQIDEIKSLLDTTSQSSVSEEASKNNLDLLSDKVSSLEWENKELKTSRKILEETFAAQSTNLSSLERENEELKTSRNTLEETFAAQSTNLSSLERESEELKTSRNTLEETFAAQSTNLSSLERENEELKTSRNTLEETFAAQSTNLSSLERESEELKTSRKTLEETVAAQSTNLSSLERENEELKTSRKTFEKNFAAQSASIVLYERKNEELRISNEALEKTVASQSVEISSLQETVVALRDAEEALKEGNLSSKNEEVKSLQGIIDQLRSSNEALKETNTAQNEALKLLQVDNSQLNTSEQTFKEKCASQSEELSLLQATIDELKSSEVTLKDKNLSQKEELNLLQGTIDELKSSEQTLKDKNVSQSVKLSSLQATIDELKSSEQTLKDKNMSQSEELSSLQATIDELKSSEQTLKDKNMSQSEELSLLQATTDELKSSEQTLKDKNMSQSEELRLLKATIDELESSEQVLTDKNVSQSEELKLLKATIDELESSEQVLTDKNVSQSEELRLLKATIDELESSEQVLTDKNVSQSEELRLLKATINELESSEQVLTDKNVSQSEELSLLKAAIDELRTSEQTLTETIVLQNEEIKSLQAITDKFGSDLSLSVDNVQKFTKKNQQKFQLQCPVKNGEEDSKTEGQLFVDAPDHPLGVEVATDSGRDAMEVFGYVMDEDDSLKKFPSEKDVVWQQFDEDNQVLQEQLETVGKSETDNDIVKTCDGLDEHADASLEIISLREQVKHLKEEVISLREAYPKPLLSSEIEGHSQFEEEAFQKEQTATHLQAICAKQEKRIKDLEGDVVNAVENYKVVHEKLTKLEQAKVEEDVDYDEEMAVKLMEKENLMKELEQLKISKKHFEDKLEDLKQEIEKTCTKMNSTAKTQAQELKNMDTEEVINVDTEVNLQAAAKVGSEQNSLIQSIHQQYESEFDQVRTNFEHEIGTIKQERDSSAKFYETRIADLEQTGLMFQEDLAILMEKLSATTKRCTLAERAAEHYKLLVQRSENADLKSQFKLDMELDTSQRGEEIDQLKDESEEHRFEAEIISKDELKQTADGKQLKERLLTNVDEIKLLTSVPSAENLEEWSFDGRLESKGTMALTVESANTKPGLESCEREFSAEFYEARIADLEQTSAMLQEDLTILMEKLNTVTACYSQAEKDVEHYKQLLKGVEETGAKSQCQDDVEAELKQREGEIVQLKRELEEQRIESQRLSEKLMKSVENERSMLRLQSSVEEFEKCGAAMVGSLEQQWLDVSNDRTSAGDVSRVLRENVHVEHFKGDVEGVPLLLGEGPGVMEHQLNLLPFSGVPLQSVQVDQSGGELERIRSSSQLQEVPVRSKEQYEKELKKLKSDFKSELRQHAMENNRLKELQKELLHEVEVLKSSIQMSSSSNVKLYVTEPTELEYLRNILYKYMLGLETKTLAKVICTVVKFSADQTRKVLEREDSKNKIFFTEPR